MNAKSARFLLMEMGIDISEFYLTDSFDFCWRVVRQF